jgi:peptidyl-prolyl cis-trans isomerase C
MTARLIRDPLLHFFVAGGVLFAVYFGLERGAADPVAGQNERIVVDQAQLDHLTQLWQLRWKREPAPDDLDAIIDRHLRQEVFYREALKMNLDHNDDIIKKRLAQKMEAVASDLSALTEPPSEERLRQYFHERAEFFTLPQAYELRQVLFLPGEERARMEALLAGLRSGDPVPAERQNKLSLPETWALTPVNDLDNAFGGDFVAGLDALPVGEWSGPLRSGYGWHLVLIEDKQPPRLPDFAEVRDFVAREYEYQSVLDAQERVYRNLLARYEVIITADLSRAGNRAELATN